MYFSSNIRGEFHDGFSEIGGYSTDPFYVVSSNKKGSNGTFTDYDNCYIGKSKKKKKYKF